MTCPNCGHENPAETRFCGVCGSTLAEGDAERPVEVSDPTLGGIPPRDLGELIGETFRMYRASFWPFVVIALVPEIPFFVSGFTPQPVTASLILVGIALLVLQAGAFVCAVVGQIASRKVDAVECYRAAWPRR